MARSIVKRTPAMSAYLDSLKEPDTLFRDIQQHVLKKASEPSGHRSNVIYPSEVVKAAWCRRATYRRIVEGPVPQRTTFTRENIFEEGNRSHAKWQRWLAEMGRLEGDWFCRACRRLFYGAAPRTCQLCGADGARLEYREIRFNAPELMLGGRCDGYCPQDQCLIEIKTMGLGGLRYELPGFVARYEVDTARGTVVDLFRLWKEFRRPLPSAVKQGNLYLHLARTVGGLEQVRRILFIYDFKATQETRSFTVEYDESAALEMVRSIEQMAHAVRTRALPDCTVNPGGGSCRDCDVFEQAAR